MSVKSVRTFLRKTCTYILKSHYIFSYIFCKVGFFIEKNAKMYVQSCANVRTFFKSTFSKNAKNGLFLSVHSYIFKNFVMRCNEKCNAKNPVKSRGLGQFLHSYTFF